MEHQRASYLALHSSLFRPDGAVFIIMNSIKLFVNSVCAISNGAHANNHASKCIKNPDWEGTLVRV